ncbi:MAG: magnesium transporter MgtE N-terminal domain-containing protein [Acidobacteriota bacterium]
MASEVARPREEFFYLSRLLDRPVLSRDGDRVGRLVDVGCASGEVFPRVVTYYVRPGSFARVTLAVPAPAFEAVPSDPLRLAAATPDLQAAVRRQPGEILLRKEILDKQIVDTDGARVVRVNDVHALRARGNEVRVVHVDIGFRGIIRRLGWESAVTALARGRFRERWLREDRLLSWRYVVPLRSSSLSRDLRLNIAQTQLKQLHPAELAEILEELDRFEGPAMLEALDVPTAAETLAEVSPEVQRLLLAALDVRRAAALLAEMPPDEAADVLEELPDALRDRLVSALPAADAATVTNLLSHEPDSAGSVMNPEVFTVPPGSTLEAVTGALRAGTPELVRSYGVVVVDPERRVRGIVPLTDLIRSEPRMSVDEVMDRDPVAVRVSDPMRDVAELFDRFNLLALPVTDEEGHLAGVIAVDDVVAWLREGEGREGRLT